MTTSDIIRMAIDAHLFDDGQEPLLVNLEKFAALVAAEVREPLSEAEIFAIWPYPPATNSVQTLVRAIEAAHGIKP